MINLALINALVIYGWYWAAHFNFRDDDSANAINLKKIKESDVDEKSKMIFWRIRFYALKWFGEYWSKPIITCPICMASLHSTYIYFILIGTPSSIFGFYAYALHILITAGMGAIIVQFEKE